MKYIMVDIESDGPIPGDYSMLSLGAVVVDETLDKKFYAELKPISDKYNPEGVQFHGFTREQSLTFREPKEVMTEFVDWVKKVGGEKPVFVSDNNGYDWMFVCWYCWHFTDENPLGYDSRNMADLYKGIEKNIEGSFKHLRTQHNHNALVDAVGNAEVMLKLKKEYGLKF